MYDLFRNFFSFRSVDEISSIITQIALIIVVIIILLVIIFVVFDLFLISIHHYIWDKNPFKIPQYVKKSAQFADMDDDDDISVYSFKNEQRVPIINPDGRSKSDLNSEASSTASSKKYRLGRTYSQKSRILDNFIQDCNNIGLSQKQNTAKFNIYGK